MVNISKELELSALFTTLFKGKDHTKYSSQTILYKLSIIGQTYRQGIMNLENLYIEHSSLVSFK